ncbi:MAG: glycosyltransferase [Bacteroidota bacterium]
MSLFFSIVVPVYNRPNEIRELLESLLASTYTQPYEIVIVEDGSTASSETVITAFKDQLPITYLKKHNTGPGDSRNYGMRNAKGNYFIILDSDCMLPPGYLSTVGEALETDYVHCYGGPDAAHNSFSHIQKAINYTMTSFFTTGGIRGGKTSTDRFQPRSFNMGISRQIFDVTGGFGNIHPGEDPDFVLRIWSKGYTTKLISGAYVYHKRRIDWQKFYDQTHKFGLVRPILNKWHMGTAKITYWFPSLFCLGFLASLLMLVLAPSHYKFWFIGLYLLYFGVIFIDALQKTKNISVSFLVLVALPIQFIGYGYGFLKSTILVNFSKREPEILFPKLFFKMKT